MALVLPARSAASGTTGPPCAGICVPAVMSWYVNQSPPRPPAGLTLPSPSSMSSMSLSAAPPTGGAPHVDVVMGTAALPPPPGTLLPLAPTGGTGFPPEPPVDIVDAGAVP